MTLVKEEFPVKEWECECGKKTTQIEIEDILAIIGFWEYKARAWKEAAKKYYKIAKDKE